MIDFAGQFPRGGTIRLALDFKASEGEKPSDIDLVEADLRFAGYKPTRVTDDMEKVGTFEIEERSNNAGWFLTLADTAELSLGWYVVDLRLTMSGDAQISPPACFQLTEAVTRRPE